MDAEILLWIQENVRQEWLTPIVKFITYLGNAGAVWIALALVFLLWRPYRRVGVTAVVAMLFSFIFNNLLLKNLVSRIRPYEVIDGLTLLVAPATDFSFPSGHSATSFAAAVVFVKLLGWRKGVWFLLLALCISLSRLYVGIHYPTDVLFGIASGTLMGMLGVWAAGRFFGPEE